jgi:hypothetical protein
MTNTYAQLAFQGAFDRVRRMDFFRDFKFSQTKALPIQVDDLPHCGIYFINELQLPEGEAQTGEIRFHTSMRIGFSIMVINNYSEVGQKKADQGLWEIQNGLFSDPTFYNNDIYKIQSFTRGERMHVFGTIGQNETPVVELQWDLSIDLGVIPFEPFIPDVLETVHVDARPLLNPNAPLVEMQWDIVTANDNGATHVRTNVRQAKQPRKRPASPGRRSIG